METDFDMIGVWAFDILTIIEFLLSFGCLVCPRLRPCFKTLIVSDEVAEEIISDFLLSK
jgi:hypothetical protein